MKRFRAFLKRRRSSKPAPASAAPAAPATNESASAPRAVQAQPVQAQAAQQPLQQKQEQRVQAASGPTLTIALQNQTNSNTVYAYVTGRALDNGNAWLLLRSDAVTPYYPTSPSQIMQPLGADCAIRLGAPGSTIQAQIPHIAGGRIWFSIDQPLTFFLNPGPSLVEPSVTNPSDPNSQIEWGFAEFTWNNDQIYANISYVDFVGLPIALTLNTQNSGTYHVSGIAANGLQQIADGLRQQTSRDGQGWDQLIVNRSGSNQILRVLSPNQGMIMQPDLFRNYYEGYVTEVFISHQNNPISVDTQAAAGVVTGQVQGGSLNFNGSSFSRPTTHDIFSCNTGPFVTGSNPQTNAIIPRLAAAYNRSTLLTSNTFPAAQSLYYQNPITNHYSRVVHQFNLDGKGYAFPYDDVQPTGGKDQSGEVHAGDPTLFTVTVGGNNAHVG